MDVPSAEKEIAEILVLLGKGSKVLGIEEFMRLHERHSLLSKFISDEEYQELPFEKRIDWWAAATYRQMRWQAEEGYDQLQIFDKTWFEKAKLKEPRILEVLESVCVRFGMSVEVVKQLIEKELGSDSWKAIRSSIPETVIYV